MQLIKALESARGNGTSMISLILPPKDQVGSNSCLPCMVRCSSIPELAAANVQSRYSDQHLNHDTRPSSIPEQHALLLLTLQLQHPSHAAGHTCCAPTLCHLLRLNTFPLTCFILQISRVQKMLGDEYGTASNIKSRVNRLSVLGAITSAQQRLKLYNKVLPSSGNALPGSGRAECWDLSRPAYVGGLSCHSQLG